MIKSLKLEFKLMKSLSCIDYREAVDIDEMVAKTGFWHAPPGSLQD